MAFVTTPRLERCLRSTLPRQPPITKGSLPKTPQPTSGTTMTSASKICTAARMAA